MQDPGHPGLQVVCLDPSHRNCSGLCLSPTVALGCPMPHMQQTQPVLLNMFYSQSGAGQCQASATHWAEQSESLYIEGFPLLAQLLLVL